MTIDVSNNNPRIEYSVSQGASQSVFTVPFEFFDNSDVKAYVDDVLKSEGADYSLAGGDGSTGTLTFTSPVVGATGGSIVVLVRHTSLERTTDFVAGQDINRAALNEQLDTIVAQIADLDDRVDRTIHLNDSEVAPSMLLTDDRKGRVMAFNSSTGAVEAGPLSNDIATIADNIAEILAADDEAAAAAASATAAATSASAASTSATAAQTAQAAAELAETTALIAESGAGTAQTNAQASALAALASEIAAGTSETNAAASETSASTSETNAAASAAAALASETAAAASEAGVDADRVAAEAAATAAAASETAASTSETNAATSETNAASSASAASTSETNAAASETAASASEANAAASEAASSTSETNAAASAAAASASETNAATSETNAANSATASASSATASAASATAASASETAASASETAAAASEAAASTSETNAAASETAAAASETAAASSASSASTSASNAASSASSASASADAALAALDNFDDRYLGQKASDPTLDNDGDALVAGALYFNTTDDVMKVYEGSVWVAAYASLSGALLVANNLSDVADVASSRTNLGLGTAATTASTDYATAAQGALADSAVQPNDSPTFAGLTTTGNMSFGDNDKAIFGAGSDLQIYHDGSNSYVDEVGSGTLLIRTNGTSMRLYDTANSVDMIRAYTGGSVRIFNDGSQKFSTTSTGIDVTGTVTADGLTVDGAAAINGANLSLDNAYYLSFRNAANTSDITTLTFDANDQVVIDPNRYGTVIGNSANPSLKVSGNRDISFYEATGTTPKFHWSAADESLGIGTSSPSNKLDVKGTVGFEATNSTNRWLAYTYTDNTFRLNYNGAGADEVVIDSSGNVGIGTSSPSELLHVDGTIRSGVGTAADPSIKVGDNNTGFYYVGGDVLGVTTGGSEAMRIDSSGNLLVGKTVASISTAGHTFGNNGYAYHTGSGFAPLSLNRQTSDGSILDFYKDGSTVGSIGSAAGTNSNTVPYICSDQSGTLNVGLKFDADPNQIHPCQSGGADRDAEVSLGGSSHRFKDGYFSGTVNAANFNTTSDATLKTNVEALTGSLDAVNALRGVSFDWIESGSSEVGFIAQEVEDVLPEVVSTNDQGIKSVKYGNMVAVLVEAIKEQQLRIEALEAKLEG